MCCACLLPRCFERTGPKSQAAGTFVWTACLSAAGEMQSATHDYSHCLPSKRVAGLREVEGPSSAGFDPKVVEVYTAVGKIMSRYSAGKVPKAFKIVPTLKNWEEARGLGQLKLFH